MDWQPLLSSVKNLVPCTVILYFTLFWQLAIQVLLGVLSAFLAMVISVCSAKFVSSSYFFFFSSFKSFKIGLASRPGNCSPLVSPLAQQVNYIPQNFHSNRSLQFILNFSNVISNIVFSSGRLILMQKSIISKSKCIFRLTMKWHFLE